MTGVVVIAVHVDVFLLFGPSIAVTFVDQSGSAPCSGSVGLPASMGALHVPPVQPVPNSLVNQGEPNTGYGKEFTPKAPYPRQPTALSQFTSNGYGMKWNAKVQSLACIHFTTPDLSVYAIKILFNSNFSKIMFTCLSVRNDPEVIPCK